MYAFFKNISAAQIIYRVIHKSLRISDLCGTVAGMVKAEGEHVNRGRDTPAGNIVGALYHKL